MDEENELNNLDNIIEEYKDFQEAIKNRKKNIEVPEYRKSIELPKKKTRFLYIIPLINVGVFLIVFIFLLVIGELLSLFGILFFIFGIPLFLISLITFFAKAFIDRKKIKNKVIPILHRNFIVANFLTSNRKKYVVIAPINNDGISFTIGKSDYIIDKEVIWFDEENRPNSFYVPELPNPLKFNFENTIGIFLEKINNAKDIQEYIKLAIETDIAFSSLNLQMFKKDKIFNDFKTAEGTVSEKFIYMLGGFCVLLLIGLILAVIL